MSTENIIYNVILLFKYFFYFKFFCQKRDRELCFYVKRREKEYKKRISEEIFYRKKKKFHTLSKTVFFRVFNCYDEKALQIERKERKT